MWLYSWIQVGTQAFGAIRKAGTVVVVGVSNEREGAPTSTRRTRTCAQT